MAQSEVFELVVIATDKAGPSLERVSKSLDQANFGVVNLDASMRDSVDNLRRLGIAQRDVSQAARSVQAPMRELSEGSKGSLKATSVSATSFASKIGSEVFSAITRLGGPILAATASIAAFHKKLVDTKTLNEMARSLGVPIELIKGMRRTATEFGIPTDQIDQSLTSLLGKFQDMKVMGRGGLYESLWQVQGGQKLAGRLHSLMGEVGRGEKTEEEGQKEAVLETLKFIREYREAYGETFTARMLKEVGLDEGLAAFGRLPLEEHAKRLSGFGSGKELDPEQVENFWKAWREFSRALGNFTTAVLTPILPKLTEFMARVAKDKELQKFADETFPKICKNVEVAYRTLKDLLEGNTIEWDKVFGSHLFKLLEKALQDFFNQAKRMWQQFKAGIGLGSQADIDAARKEELLFRKEHLGPLDDKEAKELEGLEAGQPGAAGPTFIPRVSSEREQAIIDLMESYRQRQKFADIPEDDEALRVEIENTRALKDLTEEIRKLNMRFMRAAFPAGTGGADVEGRRQGGPVAAGRSYLVGEGGTPELFVPRQEGGLVQAVGMRGQQLFTPAQSGAIVAPRGESFIRPWKPGDQPPTGYSPKGPFPTLSPQATPIPLPPGYNPKRPGENVLSGVTQGRGIASWYSRAPGWHGPGDTGTRVDPNDPAGSAKLDKIPDPYQGIALASNKTLGQFSYVTDPHTGLTSVQQQTDIGPGVRVQKLVDISAAAGRRLGYDRKSFESLQGKGLWDVQPTGFGTARPVKSGSPLQKFTSDPTFQGREDEELSIGKSLERYDALREQQAPVAFRGGPESAAEAEAHIPPAEPMDRQASAEQAGEQTFEGRQEGGPVRQVKSKARVAPGGLSLRDQARAALKELRENPYVNDPRPYQRAVEKASPDTEWQLRVERALKSGGEKSYRDFESPQVPQGYGPGTGLPSRHDFRFRQDMMENELKNYKGYYDRNWVDESIKHSYPKGQPINYQPNLAPGSLNVIQNDDPGYEATGSLNVNVRGPRGTNVKAEGTGPFETVNMTRRMTDQEQQL